MEEHSSNFPGCCKFMMLDLDKKVGNRICANTKQNSDVIKLANTEDVEKPYHIEIRTGCKNEPRKGDRFCKACMSEFSISKSENSSICFLQSLHPLGMKKRRIRIGEASLLDNVDGDMILVKQFGVTYKFLMRVDDLPISAKKQLKE